MTEKRIVVVGGGISGLTAAWTLCQRDKLRLPAARKVDARITLLEADSYLGGKIRTTEFMDAAVDTGADAFLARVPWATQLCQELGVGDELVSPARTTAYVWSRNTFHKFPERSVFGIPSRLADIARSGLITRRGIVRGSADLVLPRHFGAAQDDQSVGRLVGSRLGREFTERVVDPLIGGINAGNVYNLSLNSCAVQLADVATRHTSLLRSVSDYMRNRGPEEGTRPAFHTHSAGMSAIVYALAARLLDQDVEIRTTTRVKDVIRTDAGWCLITSTGEPIDADAVILATPAHVTDDFMLDVSPQAARTLRDIRYASVAIVRLGYQSNAVGLPLDASGYLVPAVDGQLTTACSWTSSKWSHLSRPGHVIMRASVGRYGDNRFEKMSDKELTLAVHRELATAMRISRPPIAADVTRWIDAFPQFEPGHETRILRLERALAELPGIALAGAVQHGLGIPSCIRTAREAAESLLLKLAASERRAIAATGRAIDAPAERQAGATPQEHDYS